MGGDDDEGAAGGVAGKARARAAEPGREELIDAQAQVAHVDADPGAGCSGAGEVARCLLDADLLGRDGAGSGPGQ